MLLKKSNKVSDTQLPIGKLVTSSANRLFSKDCKRTGLSKGLAKCASLDKLLGERSLRLLLFFF